MHQHEEKILSYINQVIVPIDVEKIRKHCKIGNWSTVMANCLDLLAQGKIKGQKTSKGWLFWTKKVVQLNPWDEAIGTLERTEESETQIIAVLSCTRQIAIALPKDLEETRKLQTLIGKKIAILRTDDIERPVIITTHNKKSIVRNHNFVKSLFNEVGGSLNVWSCLALCSLR